MILYITLGTNNLPRARAFYDAVMPTLGLHFLRGDTREIGYGPEGADDPILWINTPYNDQPATVGNGSMPAFIAPSRAAVDTFHATALTHGGSDEGEPRLRYSPNFYAAYVRDPDGNKLSAVCLKADTP
jgi:catechol 2,3-dioxygenase-like lactoylglutathione lyase family enzyme